MSPLSRPTRRTLLRLTAATTVATVTGATGCSADDRPTQVAVVWSDEELTRFRTVLQRYHHPVRVISVGDDIDAFLRARVQAGTTPDVAILPRPGLVTEYANRGWLSTLDGKLAARSIGDLGKLLNHNRKLYGVWVKAAHKSLFWYLPSLIEPPQTWDELVARVKTLGTAARRGAGPAPLSVGAADGWVLTDWFENVLAGLTPVESYDALAQGAGWQEGPVRDALDRLAELWSVPGAFPGGGRRALLTQYEESVIQVVHTRRAAMVFEGDFVESVAQRFPGKDELSTFPFPNKDPRRPSPLVVGGDAAVVFRGSRNGVDFVEWLTESASFSTWISAGGYLSPNAEVSATDYPQWLPLRRKLAGELSNSKDLRFDLSDQLPGAFTGADGVGIWRIMQDYFADVTSGRHAHGRFRAAVTRAIDQLVKAAEQAGSAP